MYFTLRPPALKMKNTKADLSEYDTATARFAEFSEVI